MSSQISTTRKRKFALQRKQRLQSAAVLSLVALLAVGEIVRMRVSLPEPEREAAASRILNSKIAMKSTPLASEELARMGVNEVGRFPILEYHDITQGRGRLCRAPDAFRRDLARLYAENYRPISLRDYLDNRIDVPAGMTPVVLTFDDARDSQFRYLPDGSIDPNCAVGILREFTRTHPDFPIKATFFVLTEWGFGQKKQMPQKMQALLAIGCDLQNHTLKHDYFGHMSDDQIVRQIAQGKASIAQIAPRANVDMLALPGGQHPRSKNNAILSDGEYRGTRYHNRAVFDAWGGPAPSPVSIKFDPLRISRIEPIEDSDGLTHWLDYLKTHPKRRYVSDGDPATISVPRTDAALVARFRLQNASLRVY
jgi:peptidoglycan/xylan/chitin deacetylase (PgdA/CDA1 family)